MTNNKIVEINGSKFRKLREFLDVKYLGDNIILVYENEKEYSFECNLNYSKSSDKIQFMKYNTNNNQLELNLEVINSFPVIVKLKIRQALSKILIKI